MARVVVVRYGYNRDRRQDLQKICVNHPDAIQRTDDSIPEVGTQGKVDTKFLNVAYEQGVQVVRYVNLPMAINDSGGCIS